MTIDDSSDQPRGHDPAHDPLSSPSKQNSSSSHEPAPGSQANDVGSKEWWEHLLDDTDPTGYTSESARISRHSGSDDVAPEFADLPGHFVPPEPPPVYFTPIAVVSALSTLTGVLLLIRHSLLPFERTMTVLIASILLVGGVIGLISRLRNPDPDEPEDPDQGAVL